MLMLMVEHWPCWTPRTREANGGRKLLFQRISESLILESASVKALGS